MDVARKSLDYSLKALADPFGVLAGPDGLAPGDMKGGLPKSLKMEKEVKAEFNPLPDHLGPQNSPSPMAAAYAKKKGR